MKPIIRQSNQRSSDKLYFDPVMNNDSTGSKRGDYVKNMFREYVHKKLRGREKLARVSSNL